MEETLGKRIVFHRKRLGLTQDALAELMGVTAQAVSKWENDQSCPDIGALPKLAEIFGISTDELLGVERKEVHPAEIVPADGEENDVHPEMTWELSLDDGKKGGIGLAIWILLVGGIMLTSYLLNFHAKLWDVLWPSALLVFGIFGLFPRFSFFRLGCSLFGLYFLMSNLNFAPFRLGREFLLPVLLLLFGGSLLVDTLRKSKNGTHNSGCFSFHPTRNSGRKKEHCTCTGNFFDCDTAFGENHYTILLPTLGGGSADAAAALRALWRLWRLDEATGYSSADTLSALCDVGVRLGADIPFCLHDAPRRAQGVGELLSPIAVGRTFPLVLIQPCAPLSTGEVFAAYHQLPTLAHPDTPAAVRALADGNLAALAACGGNVLESASIPMRPEIAAARQALWQNGAAYAQMTGSGSVVFGAFCDEAAACRAFLVLKGQYDACILTHTAL